MTEAYVKQSLASACAALNCCTECRRNLFRETDIDEGRNSNRSLRLGLQNSSISYDNAVFWTGGSGDLLAGFKALRSGSDDS